MQIAMCRKIHIFMLFFGLKYSNIVYPFSISVPRHTGELPGWVSPCLPGHGHQHWRPDPKTLRTPSLPRCLCLANLRQVLWSRRRKVLCSLPWNLAQSLQCFRDLTTICTVGFEPNIIHNEVLHRLEEQYKACGWRVGTHFQS